MAGEIIFDQARYAALKLAYAEAVKNNQEVFQFEGHDVLVGYAKYLILHLKTKFEN